MRTGKIQNFVNASDPEPSERKQVSGRSAGKGIRGSLGGAKKKSKSAGRYSSNKTASSDGLDAPGGDGGDHAAGMPFLLRRVGLENRERKCEVTNENMWKYVKEFAMEEEAVGVVEIILILVVLISLVIIFKEQLTALVKKILTKITKQSNTI